MRKNTQKDVLDEMSKDELLAWIRRSVISRPKRSELLYLRWDIQSEALQDDYSKEIRSIDHLDFSVRDRYANEFNATSDSKRKLKLLELMEPYDKAMSDHIARYQVLDARQAKVDKLYDQIDIERNKERA